jgi:virulence-associated protein VagC
MCYQALNLDEVAGIRKNPEPAEEDTRRVIKPLSGSWNQTSSAASQSAQVSKVPHKV